MPRAERAELLLEGAPAVMLALAGDVTADFVAPRGRYHERAVARLPGEAGELRPDSELTGVFEHDESAPDIEGVRHAINDAREEALIRQQGREAAAQDPD